MYHDRQLWKTALEGRLNPPTRHSIHLSRVRLIAASAFRRWLSYRAPIDYKLELGCIDQVQLDEKNVINNEEVLWLNGTVPYTISSTFCRSTSFVNVRFADRVLLASSERKLILQAMSVITQHTFGCVKFRPQQSNKDFIRFVRQIG